MTYRRGVSRSTFLDGSRVYRLGSERFWSVTTILNIVAKPALIRWSAKQVAEFAVTHRDLWAELEEREAVDLLKGSPWRERDRAADLGLGLHDQIERLVAGQTVTDVTEKEAGYLEAFRRFYRDFHPTVLASELTIFNRRHAFAGTLDLIIHLPGNALPQIADIKTGKSVYGEVQLQLCGYRLGEFFIDDQGNEQPLPDTSEEGLVLHLKGDGSYELHPVDLDEWLPGRYQRPTPLGVERGLQGGDTAAPARPPLTAVSVDPTGPDSRWGPRCRKDPDTRKEGPS